MNRDPFLAADPRFIEAHRNSANVRVNTGQSAPFGNVRIQTEGPSEARIVAGGLLKLALWPVLFVVAAIFVAAFSHHGVADRGQYPVAQMEGRR